MTINRPAAAILLIALIIGALTVDHPLIAIPCLVVMALAAFRLTTFDLRKRKE